MRVEHKLPKCSDYSTLILLFNFVHSIQVNLNYSAVAASLFLLQWRRHPQGTQLYTILTTQFCTLCSNKFKLLWLHHCFSSNGGDIHRGPSCTLCLLFSFVHLVQMNLTSVLASMAFFLQWKHLHGG